LIVPREVYFGNGAVFQRWLPRHPYFWEKRARRLKIRIGRE
jgi:hypothetical protein